MKTKTLLLAALVGVAAASAQAGVSWRISIGLPLPVVYSQPVVCAPPVRVRAATGGVLAPCPPPAPPVFVQTVPVCPGPDYVWVNGCWSYHPAGYATGYGFPVNHPVQFQHRVEHIERDQYLRGLRR